jgi:TonB-linked SusC/RagA family outer membrane protein
MKKNWSAIILVFLCWISNYALGQGVSGVVYEKGTEEPIVGVNISVPGTTIGTISDVNGKFSMELPAGTTKLNFSFIGYKNLLLDVKPGGNYTVFLESDFQQLSDVVVVGFGTQKKENLTGAVTSVDAQKALESKPITTLSKGLQGVAPGLSVSFNNGRPGASSTLNIRGIGTLTSNAQPLVLVDGVPSSLDLVNPEDVANISVLKDAASASIYGARAAFGVILITTKTGKNSDKVTVSYSGNLGFNNPSKLVQFMDPVDELPVMIAAQERAGNANAESFGMLYKTLLPGIINWKEKYANNRKSNEMVYGEDWEIINSRAYFYRIWDPHKEMLRSSSPQTTHNIQVSGNIGEKSSYMASIGYLYEKGIMNIQTETNRKYTINFGFNTQLSDWLKGEFKVYSVDSKLEEPYNYYGPGVYGEGANGYFGYYMRWGKFFPYGTYRGTYFRHASGFLANANMNEYNNTSIRLSGALEAEIKKGLTWRNEYSVTTNNYQTRLNGGVVSLWNFWGPMNAATLETDTPPYIYGPLSSDDRVAERRLTTRTNVFNSYFTYTKSLNESHNFKAVAGTNIDWYNYDQIYSEVRGLMDREMPEFRLAYGEQFISTARFTPTVYNTANAGFFGRVNYDFRGKYLVELNGRIDGSSSFPGNELWGFFPSASVGYRITEEPFMQNLKPVLTDAKIRASYGAIGNQNVGLFRFIPLMSTYKGNWINGDKQVLTANQPTVVDPTLTWEKVVTTNIGVDVRLIEMFGISFDWFQRETEGMFAVEKGLPSVFGASAPFSNAGNLRNRGFELVLDFNKKLNNKASIYANLSLADSRTVVTKWNNPSKALGVGSSYYYSGMEVGEIWGLVTDRLYQESDFSGYNEATKQWILKEGIASQTGLARGTFTFGPGDVKYKDLNNDGVIDAGKRLVDDHGDLKKIGNTTPRYLYGIRIGGELHGFDIDMFFQGVGKRDYWASSDLILPFYNRTDAMYENQSDYWTADNTDAFFPRPYPGHAAAALSAGTTGSNNFVTQSRYLLDMSYLRFKNLTVGYTIPKNLTSKIMLEKARIYFSGQNLAERVNDRLPVDPEIDDTEANWGRTYPFTRTYSFGVQVTF